MTTAARGEVAFHAGAEGNARLTATNAAVIFVLLAVEGVTVLSVRSLLRIHVLIGLVLVPPVLLKIGSTAYRAARYYLGTDAYRHRGPPPVLLRVLGPLVVVSSIAVLATGVALLLLGPAHRTPWLFLHKATFVVWFAAMTVHVLGHIVETVRIAPADWRRRAPSVAGATARRVVLVITVVAGLTLGIIGQSRVDVWLAGRDQHDALGR